MARLFRVIVVHLLAMFDLRRLSRFGNRTLIVLHRANFVALSFRTSIRIAFGARLLCLLGRMLWPRAFSRNVGKCG